MRSERDPIAEAHRQWREHGWLEAADGMSLVTSIARSHQLLMERIDGVLRPLDLTFARYEILRLLAFTRAGALPMTRLGSLLQVHPASVTSAVNRLESQGFVERLRREQDRRVVLAAITPAGHDVVEVATEGLNTQVFEDLGIVGKDVQKLTALLGAFREAAGDAVAT